MYYIGLDIGSSSVKVALVKASSGTCVLSLNEPTEEMEIQAIQHDWAEQNPERWWQHTCAAIKRILKETKISASEIISIGIAYQMHGLVIVDKDGQIIRNSIIWCDSRSVAIGNKAFSDLGKKKCSNLFFNSPGNFTASKLKWVQENEPKKYDQIHKYMLPGDYIAYKLSGVINTTKNGLAEGILWNYKHARVADEILDYYSISKNLTPDIVENFSIQGSVNKAASIETGLMEGTPITYRAGDQPNNALTLGVLKAGEVAVTGGTSGVIYALTEQNEFEEIERVNQFAHVNYTASNPYVGRLLNINGAGIQYRWLLKHTNAASYDDMNEAARKIPIGCDGVICLPFGNGAERMFHNRVIGSQFLNLNLNRHNNGHLYRASLEGIAFAFVYGMELLKKDNTEIQVIRAGNDNLFRSKIFSETIATLTGHEIEIYNTTGAVGAARASGLTDGDFQKFNNKVVENDHVITYKPLQEKQPFLMAYGIWKKELEQILKFK